MTAITEQLRQQIIDEGLTTGWTVQLDYYREATGRIIVLRPMSAGGITAGQIQQQPVEVWCVGLNNESPEAASAKAETLLAYFNTPANNVPIYQTQIVSGIMPVRVSDSRPCYLFTINAYNSRNEAF